MLNLDPLQDIFMSQKPMLRVYKQIDRKINRKIDNLIVDYSIVDR